MKIKQTSGLPVRKIQITSDVVLLKNKGFEINSTLQKTERKIITNIPNIYSLQNFKIGP